MSEHKTVVAAIDTGGTKIAGAAVDSGGNIMRNVRYPNDGRTGEFMLSAYAAIVD